MASVEKPRPKAPDRALDVPHPLAADRRIRFNVEQYYKMAEVGILKPGQRVELIDGDILRRSDYEETIEGVPLPISPIGSRHAASVDRLTRLLQDGVHGRGIVRVQGPFRVGNRVEPEPDLLVLRPKPDFYASALPEPTDVLVLFEVMITSARYDRKVKLSLFAQYAVPEVWLVDLDRELIEVRRRPVGGVYKKVRKLKHGQSLAPEAFPDVVLAVDAILG